MICPIPELATSRFLCLCGCGEEAPIITKTCNKRGLVKGQFHSCVWKHYARVLVGQARPPEQIEKAKRFGSAHWNYGIKASEETRAKISKSVRKSPAGRRGPEHWRYGTKISEASRAKMSKSHKTRHAENPRGYNGPSNQRDRGSPAHVSWRTFVYERDNYMCQECGQVGGKLHAHHIKSWAKYPDLRYELSNGVTLCAEKCHRKASGWKGYI